MTKIVTVSSKRQITIPVSIFKRLNLQPGSKLAVEVEGEKVILRPAPESKTELFWGSAKGSYGEQQEIDTYVQRERASWKERS